MLEIKNVLFRALILSWFKRGNLFRINDYKFTVTQALEAIEEILNKPEIKEGANTVKISNDIYQV